MVAIPEGFAQINFKFGGVACPSGAEVTFGCDVSAYAGTPVDLATLAASEFEGVVEQMTTQLSLLSTLVKFGPNETGPSAEVATPHGGIDGGAAVPPNTSILVQKQTTQGGRSGKGRCYLPGFREDKVDGGGNVDATNLGNIGTALEIFRANMETADVPLVVLHGPNSPFTVPGFILELVPQAKVATQRRRLRR